MRQAAGYHPRPVGALRQHLFHFAPPATNGPQRGLTPLLVQVGRDRKLVRGDLADTKTAARGSLGGMGSHRQVGCDGAPPLGGSWCVTQIRSGGALSPPIGDARTGLGNRLDRSTIRRTICVHYMLWIIRGAIADARTFAILPYFDRPVGGTQTFGHGKSLPRHSRFLDQIALERGVQPLAAFGFNDDMDGEPLRWHAASDGRATLCALIAAIEAEDLKLDDADDLLADLRRIREALAQAEQVGARFCLLVRMGNRFSFMEFDVRKGYVGDEWKSGRRPVAAEGE